MPYLSTPTESGVYRIKVFEQDLCVERVLMTDAGLKLSPLSDSSRTQNWKLEKVGDAWTITSAYDQWGVARVDKPGKYWGRSYPCPQKGSKQKWSILPSESGKYSKIRVKHDGTSGDPFNCFDSVSPSSDGIHLFIDQPDQSSGPKQCYVFEEVKPSGPLDILFLQDFTHSQAPFVDGVRERINQIYAMVLNAGNFSKGALRFGLVAFRDHKPKGFVAPADPDDPNTPFVTKYFPFTTDPGKLVSSTANLSATGGFDGPECQTDALGVAVSDDTKWRTDAIKITILITDSPPHGIEGPDSSHDNFPADGDPAPPDPLPIADKLKAKGITLHVLACEPTLSQYYKRARDFYVGLTERTGGKVFDLGDPDALPTFITGSVSELLDSEALAKENKECVLAENKKETKLNKIVEILYDKLTKEGTRQHVLLTDVMHLENAQGDVNAKIWSSAKTLKAALASGIKEITENRIKDYFLAGGAQSEPAIYFLPITQAQVENVVQKCLGRKE